MSIGRASFRALVVAAIAGAALVAVPTGLPARPVRTVVAPGPLFLPAGVACPFAVAGEPDENAVQTITEFSDGRIVTIGHASATLTNLEAGTSYVQKSRYRATMTYDAEANQFVLEASGRIFGWFFEGEQGPFGQVGEGGALLAFAGSISASVDSESDLFTSFALVGEVTDLCAALMP